MEVQLKVDSKGRICLPSEMREDMGDIVVAKKTSKGVLIQKGEKSDFLDEFKRVISSEPKRGWGTQESHYRGDEVHMEPKRP
jgi:bifunctional DNA-binding transcriptional regulator/antitoxin component of YhaV-PrlF toxin-antitoxin module